MQGRIESGDERFKESLLQQGIQLPDIVSALMNTLRIRDVETEEHSERVCRFSLLLGCQLGLDPAQMNSLAHGSLLHDIGKVGVPDRILRKPGRLTSEEWTRMREHPWLGLQILHGIPSLEGASLVVAQHHERWDGKGYPFGLQRNEIDQNARIFAVADALDAIISDRVYRMGKSFEAAADELDRGAGKQFDPAVVHAFNRIGVAKWSSVIADDPVRRNSYLTVGA
jgi:HD-GYP domain-containing protein (c-di-GMP phosphodiesterase class II)